LDDHGHNVHTWLCGTRRRGDSLVMWRMNY
jgi:hypothetical protein